MSIVVTVTEIHAPIERVFDLSRSVDLHTESAGSTRETAIAGVTSGLLAYGQEVTWRGKHFGIWQELTSRITAFSRPDHLRDSMVRGAFKRFDHDHFFVSREGITVMKDVFDFNVPLGLLGSAVDALALNSYMRRFIAERNKVIKRTAESEDWKRFLPHS